MNIDTAPNHLRDECPSLLETGRRVHDSITRRYSSLGSQHTGHSSWGAATGHIITAVVGAGVLSLPYAVSWLGWVGGPICLAVFFAVNIWCAFMLADVYEVNGRRHNRYKHAVFFILGPRYSVLLSTAQHLHLVLLCIGYHIVSADSLVFIVHQACLLAGTGPSCPDKQWLWTVVFGGIQVLMSAMPNLEAAWISSIIGAVMSLAYSLLAIILGATEASNGLGSISGRAAPPMDKAFNVLSALGNVAFAYNSCVIMIEIQDTLREPPKAAKSMRKAISVSMTLCFVLYMLVGCLGYAALGDSTPSEILLGFEGAPVWVRILGNVMVFVHLAPAYQVYAQPLYATLEDVLLGCLPFLEHWQHDWLVRAVYRTLFVCFTTLIAAALPFFGSFGGLIGALTFYPTAVLFPTMMWCKVFEPPRRSVKSVAIKAVNIIIALVTLAATAGSVSTIIRKVSSMKPFGG